MNKLHDSSGLALLIAYRKPPQSGQTITVVAPMKSARLRTSERRSTWYHCELMPLVWNKVVSISIFEKKSRNGCSSVFGACDIRYRQREQTLRKTIYNESTPKSKRVCPPVMSKFSFLNDLRFLGRIVDQITDR